MTRNGPWATPTITFRYPNQLTGEHFSSPGVGDVMGWGRPELVGGYMDGVVRVFDTAKPLGRIVSSFDTRGAGPQTAGAGAIQASPAIVDFNRDGRLDILVTTTGGNVWIYTPSLANKVLFYARTVDRATPGNFATPTVADINRDGQLDVVETSWNQYLHVWDGRAGGGKELAGFPVHLQDTSWSSPVVADLDKDGWPEIVFGYDCEGVPGQRCYSPGGHGGGYVGVVRHDGSWQKGFPYFTPDQVVWYSPAVVDLNGDGWLDIVSGVGNMPAVGGAGKPGGRQIYAIDRFGHNLPGFPAVLPAKPTSSPAIGDVNGDGKKDVVFVTDDGGLYAVTSGGALIARACVSNAMTNCPYPLHTSPVIADIDHDGRQEVVVGGEQWLDVLRVTGNHFTLLYRTWPSDANFGSYTAVPLSAAPTVFSLAGKAAVAVATDTWFSNGTRAGLMYLYTTPWTLGRADWPALKHDSARTGHG
jgi:hypothetical protein